MGIEKGSTNDRGEDAFSEVLFDVVLNLLDGISRELGFHYERD